MKGIYCHKVLPASFDDSLSYYEVICKLTDKINEVIDFTDSVQAQIDALNGRLDGVDSDIGNIRENIAALDSKVEKYHEELLSLINELYILLNYLAKGQQQWDCQFGIYTDTMRAQRDMFNDVTVHGITCDDLVETVDTVDALAECGLNVRGLAVMGLWLAENFDIPDYFRYADSGGGGSAGGITVLDLRDGIVNMDGFFMKGK